MKNPLILILSIFFSGCSIKVPYFEDLDPKYVCGNYPSPYCQPNSSTRWSKIKSGVDYNGNPNHYLGRSYIKYFQTSKCVDREITESDIIISGLQTVKASLKDNEKTKFSNKLSADIIALIKMNGAPVPPGINAGVNAEVAQKIDNTDNSTVELEYKRIDLTKDFIDKYLENCLAKTPKNMSVATGISIITVSGQWSSNKLSESMANIEASASYSILADEAKAEYKQAKDRILNGKFEPVSLVFAVAYRLGKL